MTTTTTVGIKKSIYKRHLSIKLVSNEAESRWRRKKLDAEKKIKNSKNGDRTRALYKNQRLEDAVKKRRQRETKKEIVCDANNLDVFCYVCVHKDKQVRMRASEEREEEKCISMACTTEFIEKLQRCSTSSSLNNNVPFACYILPQWIRIIKINKN